MKNKYHILISVLILNLMVLLLISASYGNIISLKDYLKTHHKNLLIEKGFLDFKGEEIEFHLQNLLENYKNIKFNEALKSILKQLNYSNENILKMPQCAFDRPIGYKLTNYGHRKRNGIIDASAEGNACPVGGLGAGAYERTISGNFRYWFWDQGNMVDDIVWANQFHIYMQYDKNKIAQTLSTDHPPSKKQLKKWHWNYPENAGKYYALFPKSGFDYSDNPNFPVKIGVLQFSPIWPENYHESSWPVAIYKWIVDNPNNFPVEVSIMLTWENMVGWQTMKKHPHGPVGERIWVRKTKDNYNQLARQGDITAIVMKKKRNQFETKSDLWGEICFAVRDLTDSAQVSYTTYFNSRGNGKDVWQQFASDGTLNMENKVSFAKKGNGLGAALAIKIKLQPQQKSTIPFAIAWDFPFMEFANNAFYRKKYTQFFNAQGTNSFKIAAHALNNFTNWEQKIDQWQHQIITDNNVPGWLKQALFNELYILIETGIWNADSDLFTYLECLDYPMFGTFDVDSYSSWHLLKLWPRLELNNVKFAASTINWIDPEYRQYYYQVANPELIPPDKAKYYWNIIKQPGMIIHDLGTTYGYPWVKLNGFDWQNPNSWKDLNPKLPLRAFRDYLYTGKNDIKFLAKTTEASITALLTLEWKFSDHQSFIPENEGIPDQTYDTWLMKGKSSFIGILWLAALKTTCYMIDELINKEILVLEDYHLKEIRSKFMHWFQTGRIELEKLWDAAGGYFHIDEFKDDIMTDQLFGLWYTKIMGLEEDSSNYIIPPTQATKTLNTIFKYCVANYANGYYGAVNGRKSNGQPLHTEQGDEVWTGTNYAFASNCILRGLIDEGLQAAYGEYYVVYSPFGHGYYFKTPEGYVNPDEIHYDYTTKKYGTRLFRALKYMRPGAVWSVYEALLKPRQCNRRKK